MIFQCLYYLLVLIVTVFQVYYPTPSDLYGAFFAIMIFSVIFLWLEFQQFLRSKQQYLTSPYNIADLIVYTLPLAGSIVEIVEQVAGVETKSTRVWSFAVLFVYIHIVSVFLPPPVLSLFFYTHAPMPQRPAVF